MTSFQLHNKGNNIKIPFLYESLDYLILIEKLFLHNDQ